MQQIFAFLNLCSLVQRGGTKTLKNYHLSMDLGTWLSEKPSALAASLRRVAALAFDKEMLQPFVKRKR
jgi:hypothetical protein